MTAIPTYSGYRKLALASALAMPGFSASTVLYLNLAGLAALLLVGFLLLRSARQQARWDGLLAPQRGA